MFNRLGIAFGVHTDFPDTRRRSFTRLEKVKWLYSSVELFQKPTWSPLSFNLKRTSNRFVVEIADRYGIPRKRTVELGGQSRFQKQKKYPSGGEMVVTGLMCTANNKRRRRREKNAPRGVRLIFDHVGRDTLHGHILLLLLLYMACARNDGRMSAAPRIQGDSIAFVRFQKRRVYDFNRRANSSWNVVRPSFKVCSHVSVPRPLVHTLPSSTRVFDRNLSYDQKLKNKK